MRSPFASTFLLPAFGLVSLGLLSLWAPTASAADEKKEFPQVKVGGLLFAHYGLNLTEGADLFNNFDIDRVYLTAKADVNASLNVRLTLDADRLKSATVTTTDADGVETTTSVSGDTRVRVFVKHAYLEWKTPAKGIRLRVGMEDTAWAPYIDTFTGLRYLAKSPADAAKFISTSDLGVQVMGDHAKGLVAWQAGVINGEGFGSPEVDASKTLQARVAIDPLAPGGDMNLPIAVFIGQSVGGEAAAITQFGAGIGFKMKYLVAWGDYFGQSSDGNRSAVTSLIVEPRIPKVINVLLRADALDPSAETKDDGTLNVLGGVSRDFYERVSGSLTYERSMALADPSNPTHGVFLRMQAGF